MNISPARSVLPLLAVVVALSGCASATVPTTGGAASSAPTAQLSQSATAQLSQGEIGRNGSTAWGLTSAGLYLSADAGRDFTRVPLPANVAPAAVKAVTSDTAGHTWLAEGGQGPSITVYTLNSTTGQWSAGTHLTPAWPTNLGGVEALPPSVVSLTSGHAGQVMVMTQLQLTHSVAIPRAFISVDGGATYTQRTFPATSDLNTSWSTMAISGPNAVAVTGERLNKVVYSADTATTWRPSSVHGVAAGGFVAGEPVFSGTSVYLPVTESNTGNSGGAFILLRSTDGGATFNPDGAETLAIGGPYVEDPTPVTEAGAAWWLASPMTGSVYRSTDNGVSWSKAPAVLPQGVVDIGATDGQNATVTIQHNVCASGKTNCSSDQYFETTTDGGKTWTHI